MQRDDLLHAMSTFLQSATFKDYCPNGLQVEGSAEVGKVAFAVTASLAAIDQARAWGADMLVVHHGYFWKGEASPIVGLKARRIQALIHANMNLVAYHLPLDRHAEVGNNAQWAQALGLTDIELLGEMDLVVKGKLPEHLQAPEALIARVREICDREPLVVGNVERIDYLGLCTGAAQDFLEDAALAGCQAYLSGEISERTTHEARELNVMYLSAGHHATERLGIQALMRWVQAQYPALETRYFEDPNPV